MARILLLDPSETARRALRGILARGDHKLMAVDTPAQAWSLLQRNPGVDFIVTELKLSEGTGLDFVRRLKADLLLKLVPVIVYTADCNREAVKQAVTLGVQNFLVKPYHDDAIFAELDKAAANPWRDRHFEEEKSFCKLMGYTPADLHKMLEELRGELVNLVESLRPCAETADARAVNGLVGPVRDNAEAAGAWCLVESLQYISTLVAEGQWASWPAGLELLDFCALLIGGRADPDRNLAPDFNPPVEVPELPGAAEEAAWLAAPAANQCPVRDRAQLFKAIEALPGCPVIQCSAASFQMIANGHPSCINPLMDLVARDPGLSAQMLISANLAHPPQPGENPIDDARLAVGQLGEMRLEKLARNLLIVEERTLELPPAFSWSKYWTHLRGTARIAQLICRDLEFNSLEPVARTAGQLHDIGKLLVAHLHPGGFRAILQHARQHRLPLAEAEKLFLGCTTADLGAHFAEKFGLGKRFANIIRWIDNPEGAPEENKLVAILSLARDLCHHNRVGASGDPVRAETLTIETTPEWRILRETVYPSFELPKFERAMHAHCDLLRTEFSGHQAGTVGDLVAKAVA
ncbi:MAG TPA: HDOD domain-containing protein [Lacunisphaera sp.]|nr:HDOD domain-containing protein [Lacunisphaera sp.]